MFYDFFFFLARMEDSGIDSDSKPTANGNSVPSNGSIEGKDTDSIRSDADQESAALMKDSSPVRYFFF